MLFGRKAREEYELKVHSLNRRIAKTRDQLGQEQVRNAELRTRIDELVEKVHELEIANAVYKERLDLLTQLPQFNAEPRGDLGLSEEREDLEYAVKAGIIGSEQLEAELEAAGLLNTEIQFAPEDYPRLGGRAS